MRRRDWTHYAAPAAFLLAVTIAVVLVRSAMNTGSTGETTTTATAPATTAATTTAAATTARTRTRTRTTATRFYTVVAGDTFAVISAKTNVPVARLEALNPSADSNALFIGQRLRIR